ncbi:EF-hand domain-containing protein [Rhizobiaceae bacterium BDR2-2]|uniref:EF-hand domain-containing protein n=1 Tax=Ectorhizobium quercum TaxID=2965071 RepID=A0AAE3N383_9HYPH|nr:EF-hand domain-containing protein [Ectorhizobium quercum]MCX8999076.1 EF-hand domain-containing protein [Ectorhizobium quercum]
MTSVTSLSAYSYSTGYKSSLDKNGDGVVSADELAAAQQSGASSSTASSSLTSGTAAGQEEETAASSALAKLSSLISSFLMQSASGESQSGGSESGTGDFFTTLDADGDGVLTQAEFLTGKPEDVSDEQSAALFATLDADGNGAVSAEEFAAMRPEGPPPPPPLAAAETEDGATVDSETSLAEFLEQIQSVIDSYLENLEEEAAEQSVLLTA